MANKKERVYMFKLSELLIFVPDVRNNADIKAISEFRSEMVFVRGKISYALQMLATEEFETVDEIIVEVEEYLESRKKLWNQENY